MIIFSLVLLKIWLVVCILAYPTINILPVELVYIVIPLPIFASYILATILFK